MSDEGAAHYYDMIDQLIEGHQFIRTNFDREDYPKNSWSIDPFGHSSTYAYLLQKSGLSNAYIQRTHYIWKRYFSEQKSLEFFWHQQFDQTLHSSLFLHMSPLHLYSFKYACGPNYNVCLEFDFRKVYGENSESRAIVLNKTNIVAKTERILEQYARLGSLFPHNVALVLLGDDFRYNFDIEWEQQYQNYMFLIEHINSNKYLYNNTEISFGTLDDYFVAINERVPLENDNYPHLKGDFIPYADSYGSPMASYWTGYFTTRPLFKLIDRELQHWLRSTEILFTLIRAYAFQTLKSPQLNTILNLEYSTLTDARQNLALFQHHDGITCTSKDYVMEDYATRMFSSIEKMKNLFTKLVQYSLLTVENGKNFKSFKQSIHVNAIKSNWRSMTEQKILHIQNDSHRKHRARLLVFNSNLQYRIEPIKFFTNNPFIEVKESKTNRVLAIQINPVFEQSNYTSSMSSYEITFIDQLPPLTLKNYLIRNKDENFIPKKVSIFTNEIFRNQTKFVGNQNVSISKSLDPQRSFSLENHLMRIIFNKNGFIEKVHSKIANKTKKLRMSFVSYRSQPKQSGAYLMKFTEPILETQMPNLNNPKIKLIEGSLTSIAKIEFRDIGYSVQLYSSEQSTSNKNHNPLIENIHCGIELKVWINLKSKLELENREIVVRFESDIQNESNETGSRAFYVDSNGFQMLRRLFIDSNGIEGNYYPMTTAMFIEDDHSRLNVIASHAHGVTSPSIGAIEIMLDRRIVYDDKRGLNEGIMNNLPVESKFWLVMEQSAIGSPELVQNVLSDITDSLLLILNYPSITMHSYDVDGIEKNGKQSGEKDPTKSLDYRDRNLISTETISSMCKYFLLNFRTLPIYNNYTAPSSSSLIILHHRAKHPLMMSNNRDYDDHSRCSTQTIMVRKSGLNSTKRIHWDDDILINSIQSTSLTGLNLDEKSRSNRTMIINSLDAIDVELFQIESFNLTFVSD